MNNNIKTIMNDTVGLGSAVINLGLSYFSMYVKGATLIVDTGKIAIDSYKKCGTRVVNNVINEETKQTSWIW